MVAALQGYAGPVVAGFEATGNYHRPLARPGGQDDFAVRLRALDPPGRQVLDAARPAALDDQPEHQGVGEQGQVRPVTDGVDEDSLAPQRRPSRTVAWK